MIDHESALQAMVLAHLKSDATLKALLGDPARIWDQPPADAAWPYLTLGRGESRAVRAEGCGVEHVLTLSCASRFGGVEEAKAVAAAVRVRLNDAVLNDGAVRTVSLRVTFTDVFRGTDFRRVFAVMRVRAVTEEI